MTLPQHTLNDGTTLPAIGLGTYALRGLDGARSMVAALEAGYRLLDSAVNYENEGAVGKAVRQSGVPREAIRVTSKLPGRHHKKAQARTAIEESVLRTGLDYLDLYLIHWPTPARDCRARHQPSLSRYHCTVRASPSSTVTEGRQPSSVRMRAGSMA